MEKPTPSNASHTRCGNTTPRRRLLAFVVEFNIAIVCVCVWLILRESGLQYTGPQLFAALMILLRDGVIEMEMSDD